MMKIKGVIFIVFVLLLSTSSYAIEPKYKDVPLKERTKFTLDIIPGMPTRLVFPFKLDDDANDPAFKVSVPNSNIFKIEESGRENGINGQNTLIIKAELVQDFDPNKPQYAAIFVSINGYHITIIAKAASLTSKKYYTDVFFNLSEDDREYLIAKQVDKRIEKMKQVYKEKEDDLEKQAKTEAIKHVSIIALNEPDIYRIKESFMVELQNEQRLELYIKEAFNYADHYYVLSFELENRGNSDIKLSGVDIKGSEEKPAVPINTSLNCPSVLKAREAVMCALVSEDRKLYKNEVMNISLVTDVGVGVVEW